MDTAPFVHAILHRGICASNRNLRASHVVDHYDCWTPSRLLADTLLDCVVSIRSVQYASMCTSEG